MVSCRNFCDIEMPGGGGGCLPSGPGAYIERDSCRRLLFFTGLVTGFHRCAHFAHSGISLSCPVKLNVMVDYALCSRNGGGMIVIPEDHSGSIASQQPYAVCIVRQIIVSIFLMEPDNLFPDRPLMPR